MSNLLLRTLAFLVIWIVVKSQQNLGSDFIQPDSEQPFHYTCTKVDTKWTVAIKFGDKYIKQYNYYSISPEKDLKKLTTAQDISSLTTCQAKGFTELTNTKIVVSKCNSPMLYIFVMKKPNVTKDLVIGGQNYHQFVIDCHITNIAFYNDVHETKTGILQRPEETENPNLKLTMKFLKQDGSEIGQIFLGDEITMAVSDAPGSKNFLAFVDCSAYDVFPKIDDSSHSIKLLKNGVSAEPGIILPATKVIGAEAGKVSIKLFAFQFPNTADVTISCRIKACHDACLSTRKRRAINGQDSSRDHFVEGSFSVKPLEEKNSEGFEVKPMPVFAMVVLSLFTTKIWMIRIY